MRMNTGRRGLLSMAAAAALIFGAMSAPARSAEIAATNYGSSVIGMPWTIAVEKGFFKDAGVDVSAVIGSPGGSTEVRNLIAGDLPYADSALIPTLKAIKNGSDLKIISDNTHTSAQFVWLVKPDSQIKTLADLKGKRISFTTPLSTSQSLDFLLIEKAGLKPGDVKLISTGAYGAALTALQNDGVDLALVSEPTYTMNKSTFKPLFWSRDLFSAINSSVGVTSAKTIKEHPDMLKGIIQARRRAVDFIRTNRDESVAIIAKVYKMDPEVVKAVLAELVDHPSSDGSAFFGDGDINPKGLDALVDIAQKTGDLKEKVDWRDYVDQSFLPQDLQRKLK
ncbi:ABC transporter substrate-binding protein [Rhizobium mayense]|uniref:ABC transporter substrate-binding protein n=1 Tax=Rhizobium mayense TaxID=1312184 RepID=A0ABT7JVG6_9HYPH|nr:ABC transporter substrate-binding protein [Rhizobium mayense]MDL2398914.1 ABC transporter substrate-binding protein [Rhizobium mayense]